MHKHLGSVLQVAGLVAALAFAWLVSPAFAGFWLSLHLVAIGYIIEKRQIPLTKRNS